MHQILGIFSVRVLSAASSIILTYFVARALPTGEAGEVMAYISALYISAFLIRYGSDQPLLKMISIRKNEKSQDTIPRLLGFVLTRVVVLFAVLFLIVLIAVNVLASLDVGLGDAVQRLYLLFLLTLLPIATSITVSFAFQGLGMIGLSLAGRQLFFTLSAVAFVGAVYILQGQLSYQTFYYSFLFSSCLNFLLLLCIWVTKVRVPVLNNDQDAREAIHKGIMYFFGTGAVVQLTQWFSPVVVVFFGSGTDAAYVAVSTRLAMLITFVFIVTNAMLIPKLAKLFSKNDIAGVKRVVRYYGRCSIAAAAPIYAVYVFFGDHVLTLFGESYENAFLALLILSTAQIINVLSGSVAHILLMSGKQNVHFYNVVYSGCLMLFGLPMATMVFGWIGAVVVLASAIILQNLLGLYKVKKLYGFNAVRLILF